LGCHVKSVYDNFANVTLEEGRGEGERKNAPTQDVERNVSDSDKVAKRP
jgi:hypothetical protein